MSAPPPVTVDPIVTPATLFDNPSAITDEVAAVVVTPGPRPGYLQPLQLPGYGTKITRICGDYGMPTGIGGTWGKTALHHYSKDQPWNDDMSMIYVEQRNDYLGNAPPATSPTKMILDGTSYLPIIGNKNTTNNNALLNAAGEFRWRPQYPDQAIGWKESTNTLTLFKLVSQQVLWTYTFTNLPAGNHFGLLSEGVLTNDGRYLVLCSHWFSPQISGNVDHFCVVDLEAKRVGPLCNVPMPYVTQDYGDIDWCSISPLGNYVVIKYSSNQTPEYARCFNVNLSTLVCTPRTFAAGATWPLMSGGPKDATDLAGWMACMSHGDFGISADAALSGSSVEVYVGGMRDAATSNYCSSADVAAHGHYVAQSMATGKHIHVSMGTTQLGGAVEVADQHASCRSYFTPEWLLATYEYSSNAAKKFGQLGGEMVLWKLLVNGGGAPVRCGCTFTDDSDVGGLGGNSKYLAEAHAVASPGCEKIMFASNWKYGSPAGPAGDYKSYILEPASTEDAAASDYVRRPEDLDRTIVPAFRLNSTDEPVE